jgi:hypothetical protein
VAQVSIKPGCCRELCSCYHVQGEVSKALGRLCAASAAVATGSRSSWDVWGLGAHCSGL